MLELGLLAHLKRAIRAFYTMSGPIRQRYSRYEG
jgi:hypothetical protein